MSVSRQVTFRHVRSIRIGPYTHIMPGVILNGPVTIGEHSWIGELDVIDPQTTIGDHVSMGPLVYLRSGTRSARRARGRAGCAAGPSGSATAPASTAGR